MQHDHIMKTFMLNPFRCQGQCHSDPKVVRNIPPSQSEDESKDQDSMQASITSDPGLGVGK